MGYFKFKVFGSIPIMNHYRDSWFYLAFLSKSSEACRAYIESYPHGSNTKFNKINKVWVLAMRVTWNFVYLINLEMKEEPFSDKYQ